MLKMDTPIQRIDLQLFSDGVDPVDPVPTDPTPEPVDPTTTDPVEPGTPTDPQPVDPVTPQTVRVKYNHEEREIPLDEAIQLAQKGMNYDKAIERERQVARDNWIAEQGYEWNGKPITTEAEYYQAVNEKAEYDRRAQLEQQGYDPNLIDEYVDNNPVVKWAKDFKQQQEVEQFKQRNQTDFLSWFQQNNGRSFDPDKDTIPNELWIEVDKYEKSMGKEGKSLVDAYTRHENQQLKERITKLEQSLNVRDTNLENAQTSTGSVTGQGNVPTGNFTREQVEKMSQADVHKNYDAIIESMKHWK